MVDEALLKEMKVKFEAGAAASDVMDSLKVFEMFKQIAVENEDLKEELEDMDITIQMNITDEDKKFWLEAKEGTLMQQARIWQVILPLRVIFRTQWPFKRLLSSH